jgi:DNA-binding response OmpR family regulator
MKILICESEEVLLAAIEFRLKKQGYQVVFCKKKSSVLEHLIKEDPDLVIVDLDMGKQSGLEIIKEVKEEKPKVAILMLADPEEEEQIMEGFNLGINDFLSKPFKPAELIIRVQRILTNQKS